MCDVRRWRSFGAARAWPAGGSTCSTSPSVRWRFDISCTTHTLHGSILFGLWCVVLRSDARRCVRCASCGQASRQYRFEREGGCTLARRIVSRPHGFQQLPLPLTRREWRRRRTAACGAFSVLVRPMPSAPTPSPHNSTCHTRCVVSKHIYTRPCHTQPTPRRCARARSAHADGGPRDEASAVRCCCCCWRVCIGPYDTEGCGAAARHSFSTKHQPARHTRSHRLHTAATTHNTGTLAQTSENVRRVCTPTEWRRSAGDRTCSARRPTRWCACGRSCAQPPKLESSAEATPAQHRHTTLLTTHTHRNRITE